MADEKEVKEEKKDSNEEYKVVSIATQTAPAIQTPEGKVLTTEQVLVEILNKLKLLEKL